MGRHAEVFKLLEGIENFGHNQILTLATNSYAMRGHDRKLIKMSPAWMSESSFSVSEWQTLGIVCWHCTSSVSEHV